MYPRAEGHCFAHHVPGSISDYNWEDYCEDYDSDNSCDDAYEANTPFGAALTYLQNTKADLRKGDLVIFDRTGGYRNEGVTIFNGKEIVNLFTEVVDYGSVSQEFRVIEDGVPLTYWKNIDEEDPTKHGIAHNEFVWFNHALVRDQCLENATYGLIDGGYAIYTTFVYEDKKYRIILNVGVESERDTYEFHSSGQGPELLNDFCERLREDELLAFELDPPGDYVQDGSTLFTTDT